MPTFLTVFKRERHFPRNRRNIVASSGCAVLSCTDCQTSLSCVDKICLFQSCARRNDQTSGHRHNDRVHSEKRDLQGLCNNMANILETVTIPAHPDIALIKQTMMENGAMGALMSGSGPTVFGIYDNEKEATPKKSAGLSLADALFM